MMSNWVFHLAGTNRPKSSEEFSRGNVDLTLALCTAVEKVDRLIPIVCVFGPSRFR